MKVSLLGWFICLLLLMSGCNKDQENTTSKVPDTVVQKSLNLFDGSILEKSATVEEGIESWEVKIQNSAGATVAFYWNRQNTNLVKINGSQGPFDYSINADSGLLNFSTAKTLAIGAVKNDQIATWTLQQENMFDDLWTYTFFFLPPSDRQVYIDAESGDILQID